MWLLATILDSAALNDNLIMLGLLVRGRYKVDLQVI